MSPDPAGIGLSAPPTGGAQSVDRALQLLPLVGQEPELGLRLGELVEATGLSRPTVRRLLLSLMRAGLVEQDAATRAYLLGPEAYVLGVLAARRFGLAEIALGSVARLAETTSDTAFLSARRDTHATCLLREEGAYPIRVQALQVGYRHPLGIGAGSLAMLAGLDGPEADAVLAANAAVMADRYPMVAPAEVRKQVATARDRGWSLNAGMVLEHSWAIGVALRGPDGAVLGALSVAAIAARLQPDRQPEVAAALLREAAVVESRLADVLDVAARPDEPAGVAG